MHYNVSTRLGSALLYIENGAHESISMDPKWLVKLDIWLPVFIGSEQPMMTLTTMTARVRSGAKISSCRKYLPKLIEAGAATTPNDVKQYDILMAICFGEN